MTDCSPLLSPASLENNTNTCKNVHFSMKIVPFNIDVNMKAKRPRFNTQFKLDEVSDKESLRGI